MSSRQKATPFDCPLDGRARALFVEHCLWLLLHLAGLANPHEDWAVPLMESDANLPVGTAFAPDGNDRQIAAATPLCLLVISAVFQVRRFNMVVVATAHRAKQISCSITPARVFIFNPRQDFLIGSWI